MIMAARVSWPLLDTRAPRGSSRCRLTLIHSVAAPDSFAIAVHFGSSLMRKSGIIGRRAEHGLGVERLQLGLRRRPFERGIGGAVELVDDRLRRARRCDDSGPGT